jgi:hypothetical protein
MMKGSVVAIAFDGVAVEDVCVGVIEDLKDPNGVAKALASFEQHYGVSARKLDFSKYVGLILIDGLSRAEERTMEALGDRTNVLFVGGSAGDDLGFRTTHVYAHGRSYSGAAVLALLRPGVPFSVVKTQSFRCTDAELTATRVCEETRTVLEFNGKPAATAYAEAIGVAVADLPSRFMRNPLGLMVDGEPYVRSPQRICEGGIVFYCNIKEGMRLAVLEAGDIVEETRGAIAAAMEAHGPIKGLINFHCILRTLDLERLGATEDYGSIFDGYPSIGFSTYGEQYIGHVNQTSTMLLLH